MAPDGGTAIFNEANLPPDYTIPIIDGRNLDYPTAYTRFLAPNLPFIVTGLTDSWPASTEWLSSNGEEPNWQFLEQLYGDAVVGVVDCNAPKDERCPEEMAFRDVIGNWRAGGGKGLYIKDWHLRRYMREKQSHNGGPSGSQAESSAMDEKDFYTVPRIFSDDWMARYYTECKQDDFAFVYFGTEGTGTPLHRDVCESVHLSCGKDFMLISASLAHFLIVCLLLTSHNLLLHSMHICLRARHFLLLVCKCARHKTLAFRSSLVSALLPSEPLISHFRAPLRPYQRQSPALPSLPSRTSNLHPPTTRQHHLCPFRLVSQR